MAALFPAAIAILVVILEINDGPDFSDDPAVQKVLLDSYVNSVWTATDAFGFAFLALLGGLMIESIGRACAAALSATVVVVLLLFAVGFVHEFEIAVDARRLLVSASIVISLVGLAIYDVLIIMRRPKRPGNSRAFVTLWHPMSVTLASCENCSQAVVPCNP